MQVDAKEGGGRACGRGSRPGISAAEEGETGRCERDLRGGGFAQGRCSSQVTGRSPPLGCPGRPPGGESNGVVQRADDGSAWTRSRWAAKIADEAGQGLGERGRGRLPDDQKLAALVARRSRLCELAMLLTSCARR